MTIVPLHFKQACEFVACHHRHHKPPVGHKFSIGLDDSGILVGVAIIGRPVSRRQDDGKTLEVTRLCTDGTFNACSMLYARARRIAVLMGYARLITYTLPEEGGASLKAAGFTLVGKRHAGSWSVPSRPRVDKHPIGEKLLWLA